MDPLVTQLNRLENMGPIDESSPGGKVMTLVVEEDVVGPSSMFESSCRPSNEPIGVDDGVEGRARTPSNHVENSSDGRILEDMHSISTSTGGIRGKRRVLVDLVNVGFVEESSLRPEPPRRPGKEPLGVVDEVSGKDGISSGPRDGTSERGLNEMSSSDLHQALRAYLD
ncbi:uncharacterized protein A4U43_C02F9480 [Asparagus officinalis]|uniref:Uncharacterized protein n=1 Tax=Asparagus officinalis TaxID=4686 RepID=A0A5P1FJV9_ASPOF|nr:uncharacterized protein A4U43_C02F9480 [Asparagus officinalis]